MAEIQMCTSCGYRIEGDADAVGVVRCPACGELNQLRAIRSEGGEDDEASTGDRLAALKRRAGGVHKALRQLAEGGHDLDAVEAVVAAIRNDLVIGHGPHGEILDLNEMASRLSFAPRSLERVGHSTLAAELRLLQDGLHALGRQLPASASRTTSTPPAQAPQPATVASVRTSSARPQAPEPQRTLSWPVAAAVVVIPVAAILGGWFWLQSSAPPRPPASGLSHPEPVPVVEPPSTAVAAAGAAGEDAERERMRAFFDHIASARSAIQSGGLEEAHSELTLAATISTDRGALFDVAEELSAGLCQVAVTAMDEQRWHEADHALARAIGVGGEFGVSIAEAERLLNRLTGQSWSFVVNGDERDRISGLVGRRVEVERVDADVDSGTILAVTDTSLVLELENEVGGGRLRFQSELPLAQVRRLRFTTEAAAEESLTALERFATQRSRSEFVTGD